MKQIILFGQVNSKNCQGKNKIIRTIEYVPVDGTPFKALTSVNIYLWTVCYSLATVGILFALFCLVFNIVFRNRK